MGETVRPRDLPELRLELLKHWAPRGEFTKMAFSSLVDPRFADHADYLHLEAQFDQEVLRRGVLWWVDADMCDLVAHAAPSLPPTTLTDDLVPRHPVVAFFEKPLIGSDAMLEGWQFQVQIVGWMPRNRVMGTEMLTMTMYGPPVFAMADLKIMPFGRTDWQYGTDTDVATFPSKDDADDQRRAASMAEDRRNLAALVLLASQPLASSETVRPTNKARLRKLTATGLSPDVRVVGLRRPEGTEGSTDAERSKGGWGHRTIVGAETGGFWRQQAYGPGWSQHRPRWIFPYEAGPKDAPLVLRDTVKVLKSDRKPKVPPAGS